MGGIRRATVALVAIMLGLGLGACRGDDSGDEPSGAADAAGDVTATTRATSAASTTTTVDPCVRGAGYEPGTTTHQLTVAGAPREFLVHVPAPAAGRAPAVPLVVNFHGANSDMVQQAAYSGFLQLADAEGFVVAYPNGIDAPIRQWRFLGTNDDVDFARAVVEDLVANACVDPARVYAVGISSGAAMSASLACQAADAFTGFGLVAADFYIPAICDDAPPRPITVFHGTADATIPYDGGQFSGLPIEPAEVTAAAWATHNGCTRGPTETVVDTEVVRLDWSGCDEPVVMYRIVGGGHSWPGSVIKVDRLGHTTDQLDATATMWELFTSPR